LAITAFDVFVGVASRCLFFADPPINQPAILLNTEVGGVGSAFASPLPPVPAFVGVFGEFIFLFQE
jgi:hypothetical protein